MQRHATRAKYAEVHEVRGRLEQLTPLEYEIFHYVIIGMLNKQIAYELGISGKTAKVQCGRIIEEKLGVGSVADLVRLVEKASIKPTKE